MRWVDATPLKCLKTHRRNISRFGRQIFVEITHWPSPGYSLKMSVVLTALFRLVVLAGFSDDWVDSSDVWCWRGVRPVNGSPTRNVGLMVCNCSGRPRTSVTPPLTFPSELFVPTLMLPTACTKTSHQTNSILRSQRLIGHDRTSQLFLIQPCLLNVQEVF